MNRKMTGATLFSVMLALLVGLEARPKAQFTCPSSHGAGTDTLCYGDGFSDSLLESANGHYRFFVGQMGGNAMVYDVSSGYNYLYDEYHGSTGAYEVQFNFYSVTRSFILYDQSSNVVNVEFLDASVAFIRLDNDGCLRAYANNYNYAYPLSGASDYGCQSIFF